MSSFLPGNVNLFEEIKSFFLIQFFVLFMLFLFPFSFFQLSFSSSWSNFQYTAASHAKKSCNEPEHWTKHWRQTLKINEMDKKRSAHKSSTVHFWLSTSCIHRSECLKRSIRLSLIKVTISTTMWVSQRTMKREWNNMFKALELRGLSAILRKIQGGMLNHE